MREGKECYYDTYRKKLIEITPEETVRQRVASYFEKECDVQKEMIELEVPMSYYGDCLNISDRGVELGILHTNKLLFLDDKEVSVFVYKLIEYALLREEVRRDKRE